MKKFTRWLSAAAVIAVTGWLMQSLAGRAVAAGRILGLPARWRDGG